MSMSGSKPWTRPGPCKPLPARDLRSEAGEIPAGRSDRPGAEELPEPQPLQLRLQQPAELYRPERVFQPEAVL